MYPDPASKSAQLFERARAVMPGGNTRHTVYFPPYPLYAASGKGCSIVDVDGVERIDFVNNYSALIHGHANPPIVEAVARQAECLVSVGLPTESEIALAELLCERVPGIERIRFANSGTEANMLAVQAVRAYTGRPKIAKCEGAYHGSHELFEVSLQPEPGAWGDAARPASVAGSEGTPRSVLGEVVVFPFNDVDATRALLEENAGEIAAVLLDPLPSQLGFPRASDAYLSMLREVTRRHEMLLVFDEVMSFRLGYHGAQGVLGVTPELTTLGKIIGGGLAIGALGGSAEVMEVFDQTQAERVHHGGTFNAHPLAMVAGYEAMAQLTPEAFERLNALGERLRTGLRNALATAGLTGQVAGEASIAGLFLTERPLRGSFRDLRGAARDLARILPMTRHLLNHGLFMVPRGAFFLSTPMGEAEIDFTLERVLAALREVAPGD